MLGVVIRVFNPNTPEAKQADFCEIKAIPTDIASSRSAKATLSTK